MFLTGAARAYVNWGKWVADCPLLCGNAMLLEPGQTQFYCSSHGGCGHIAPVEWPTDPNSIWEALQERRMPKTRNWFPEDHILALKAGCPHGQTPEELREETHENEKVD